MDLSFLVTPAILLFLLGCYAEHRANPRQDQRHLLLLFPLVTLVIGLVELFLFDALDLLVRWLLGLGGLLGMPLAALDAAYITAMVFNIALLLSIAGIKRGYLAIAQRSPGVVDSVMDGLGSIFYRRSDEREGWFLRTDLRGVRAMLRFACVASIAVSAVLILLAYLLTTVPAFGAFLCPAFATALVSEIYYAVSGETEPEFKGRLGVEDDGAQRVYDYAGLVDALKHYFGDRLLHLHSQGRAGGHPVGHEDFCRGLIASADPTTRLAGEYCLAMVEKGLLSRDFDEGGFDELDHDMAQAMVRLLHGQSVLVATAFFHDYLPYVFFPVVSQLMRNRRVLVVAGPQVGEESLREFLGEGLGFVSGDAGLWSVDWVGGVRRAEGDDPEPPDVGLLSFADLLDASTILGLEDYLGQVALTLVLDSSGLLSTYQIGLSLLADCLSRGETPSSYCVFDRNHDGLVDALSHTLRAPFTEVVATEYASASSVGMFWEADGGQLQHRLVSGVAHNLGLGTELGLVALKEGTERVTWASGSTVPLVDQRWIDGQYYGELMGFAGLPLEQRQLDEHVEFVHDVWALPKRTHRFLMAEDEDHNLFEAYRQYATRASEQAFVNVIAPNYLFRDYMVANARVFTADPKAVPAFAPAFAPSPRNAAHGALMLMTASPDGMVTEDVLARRLRFMGVACDDCQETLGRLVDEYVAGDEALLAALPRERIYATPYETYDAATKRWVTRRRFALEGRGAYEEAFRQLRAVPIVTELPDGTESILGSHLYCHAYQAFLPGQYVTIRGKYYEVKAVSATEGVVLGRAADHFDRRHYYRPLLTIRLGDVEALEGVGTRRRVSSIHIDRCRGDFAVGTAGYLDLEDYGDVTSGHRVELEGVPDRRYKAKSLLRLTFEGMSQPRLRALAVVLNEALVTLFPKDHPYLWVVVPEAAPADAAAIPGYTTVLPGYEGPEEPGTLYVVEDSLLDIGLLESFDRNVERILSIAWDYLDWLRDELRRASAAGEADEGEGPVEVTDVEGDLSLDPEGDEPKGGGGDSEGEGGEPDPGGGGAEAGGGGDDSEPEAHSGADSEDDNDDGGWEV